MKQFGLAFAIVVAGAIGLSQSRATTNYYAYVCAESEDQVALVRFGPDGAEVVKNIEVGSFPTEIEGPHGINVSPDGRYWFVTLAHGIPFGTLYKYETGSDEWVNDVKLGMYPATLDISSSTGLLYVVNFNLHGEMKPSSISIVETETMIEVARVDTGVMPHGSRLNRDGMLHYSVNMMDDELVELDALTFEIARRLKLGESTGHDGQGPMATVKPTWATVPTRDGRIYVAGNGVNKIFEIDLEQWKVVRTFDNTGKAPYNLGVTPDGKLLVTTYKGGASVGFWDLESGREIARRDTLRKVPHGLAITPDGAYTFVTVEGIGGEPGTVEIYDNATQLRVASVEIGKQAGGIAIWKMEG